MQDEIQESYEVFLHVRVIIGMILGLAMARIVTGLVAFVQHPEHRKVWFPHLGFALLVFLLILHFWWFEFAFAQTHHWTFALYLLLVLYAVVFVMLASMVFPDSLAGYAGFRDYFERRRQWFYIFLLVLLVVDAIDTLAKGAAYTAHVYGHLYPLKEAIFAAGALGGILVRRSLYDILFVAFALLFQSAWITALFASAP